MSWRVTIRELPGEWRFDAACVGQTDVMYGPPFERRDVRERRERTAKRICATCPVIDDCRDYARRHRETDGVWGGLGELELRAPWRRPQRGRLTAMADEIRRRSEAGETQDQIAADLGCSQSMVSRTLRGKPWRR